MPKRYILSIIYFGRALAIVGLHHAAGEHRRDAGVRRGHRPALALDRAADLGPGRADVRHALARPCCSALPSSATRSAASSASGSAAVLFEATGSYDVVWWLSVFFGVASAVINLPIVEKPVARPAAAGMIAGCPTAAQALNLAHAARHPGLRLPDRPDRLRPALDARLFPDADVGGQRLGPRRVRAGDRASRCCCGARRSRSPARSPTASARSGC